MLTIIDASNGFSNMFPDVFSKYFPRLLFYFRILGDLCDSIRLLKCTKCCAHKCKFIFFCIMDVDPDLTVSGRDADPDLQFFSM